VRISTNGRVRPVVAAPARSDVVVRRDKATLVRGDHPGPARVSVVEVDEPAIVVAVGLDDEDRLDGVAGAVEGLLESEQAAPSTTPPDRLRLRA